MNETITTDRDVSSNETNTYIPKPYYWVNSPLVVRMMKPTIQNYFYLLIWGIITLCLSWNVSNYWKSIL